MGKSLLSPHSLFSGNDWPCIQVTLGPGRFSGFFHEILDISSFLTFWNLAQTSEIFRSFLIPLFQNFPDILQGFPDPSGLS
jgi:hypothetical protein